ncbi:MAG: hypothetical protein J7513_03670 [Solirubrobacteraceae bacterium]|nr:hypothetical protein [Solirubrobacteraceae bacterium]
MPLRKSHFFTRKLIASLTLAGAVTACAPAVAAAAGCTQLPTSKAFSKFGDKADYSLAPGGGFEGTNTWTLTGGAKVVSGNENLGVSSGSKSLFMPITSTATSPEFCVDETNPYFRFAMSSTHKGGYVAAVLWRNSSGQLTQAEFTSSKYVTLLSSGWQPSAVSPLAVKLTLGSNDKAATVQLKIISTGNQNYSDTNLLGTLASNVFGSVTIDSVMVDPYRRG